MIRVLLADDHQIVREGLSAIISTQDDMTVVAEATDGGEAIKMWSVHRPDIVLMDLQMPCVDGVEATRTICHQHPQARVIALTASDGGEEVYRVRQAGARAHVLKGMNRFELLDTIRRVYRDNSIAASPNEDTHERRNF